MEGWSFQNGFNLYPKKICTWEGRLLYENTEEEALLLLLIHFEPTFQKQDDFYELEDSKTT